MLRRSYERYERAMELYGTTAESLRSIAARLGLPCNSVGGFIRRNFPELIDRHNSLVAAAATDQSNSVKAKGRSDFTEGSM